MASTPRPNAAIEAIIDFQRNTKARKPETTKRRAGFMVVEVFGALASDAQIHFRDFVPSRFRDSF